MKKFIITIGNISSEIVEDFKKYVSAQKDTPVVISLDRSYFPTSYHEDFGRDISDVDAVIRANGYRPGVDDVNPYALINATITADYPKLNFEAIDCVIYDGQDDSWADEQFCLVFYGHPHSDHELIVAV